jgi:hypothetical protein
MIGLSTKHCLICKRSNQTLYWHKDPDSGDLWVYCKGVCQRGYSLRQYCHLGDISLAEFLKGDFDIKEATPNELQVMKWPVKFVPLSDPRAQKGIDYVTSRGLNLDGDMYYDMDREGIVFPYYFLDHFCGAQIRFLKTRINKDGDEQKIDTLPGTRLGMLFGLWNQGPFITNVKAVGVCEGYFNAISLQQAFNIKYGGVVNNPWKFICTSGCNVTKHHQEVLQELMTQNIKVIGAYDADEAGREGIAKAAKYKCLTHFSTTLDDAQDWNDVLKKEGHEEVARRFLANLQKVQDV